MTTHFLAGRITSTNKHGIANIRLRPVPIDSGFLYKVQKTWEAYASKFEETVPYSWDAASEEEIALTVEAVEFGLAKLIDKLTDPDTYEDDQVGVSELANTSFVCIVQRDEDATIKHVLLAKCHNLWRVEQESRLRQLVEWDFNTRKLVEFLPKQLFSIPQVPHLSIDENLKCKIFNKSLSEKVMGMYKTAISQRVTKVISDNLSQLVKGENILSSYAGKKVRRNNLILAFYSDKRFENPEFRTFCDQVFVEKGKESFLNDEGAICFTEENVELILKIFTNRILISKFDNSALEVSNPRSASGLS